MDKPIYCVFALVDGVSHQVGNATDKEREAIQVAHDYFMTYKKTRPTKVVKTYVVNEVIESFSAFKVRIVANNKIYWCHTKNEYNKLTNEFIKNETPFTVHTYSYE